MSTKSKGQNKLNKKMLEAVKSGSLDELKQCLKEGANPRVEHSAALLTAAKLGFAEAVEVLIPLSDPLSFGSQALYVAIAEEFVECVRLLLPVSHQDQHAWEMTWQTALRQSEVEIVRALLNYPPLFKHCHRLTALHECCMAQRFEFFEELLSRMSSQDLKQNSDDASSTSDLPLSVFSLLRMTVKMFRWECDKEAPDDRYLNLWFDYIKHDVSDAQMRCVLGQMENVDGAEVYGLLGVLMAKWELWLLERSTPESAKEQSAEQSPKKRFTL